MEPLADQNVYRLTWNSFNTVDMTSDVDMTPDDFRRVPIISSQRKPKPYQDNPINIKVPYPPASKRPSHASNKGSDNGMRKFFNTRREFSCLSLALSF